MPNALATITNSPYGFGGVSTWIERITKALPEFGWRVTTVTHALDEQHLANWTGNHPDMVVNPLLGRFARLNEIEHVLERYLDQARPDVVLINGSYWMIPTLQHRKQRGEKVRVVGICHADDNGYYSGLGFYRDCFDHVIGVSETCYRKLLRLGFPPERTSLLPYGVPCPAQPPPHVYGEELRLVYVGRLTQWQKRIFDFIPLIKELNACRDDYQLHFYGAGEDEKTFREQAEAINSQRRVHFNGWVPANQVATTVWRDADIFLLMSVYEGLSISMLEAMAYGVVPIVSGVESGARDVIRDGVTGYIFPVGDAKYCAERIRTLGGSRHLLAEMSTNAWALIHQEYSLGRHARRLAGLLDATLSSPARTGPARYMGMTSHPLARLVPGWVFLVARRRLRRGNPINEGYVTFP
jgi:glycosyltransferase involved in cell wall biosynthesis